MSLAIHDTTEWPMDRIASYGQPLTAALHKLAERFPNDVTVKSMAEDIVHGRQKLWLILDGDDFKSFVLTELKVNDTTGFKSVLITGLGGEGGVDIAELIADIERWAWSVGADEVSPIGRLGWKKALAAQGYSADTILYRKARP